MSSFYKAELRPGKDAGAGFSRVKPVSQLRVSTRLPHHRTGIMSEAKSMAITVILSVKLL